MQNLIILALTLVGTYLFFHRLHYKKWMQYYQNEMQKYSDDYFKMLSINADLNTKYEDLKSKVNFSKLNKQKRFKNTHVNKIENSRNF